MPIRWRGELVGIAIGVGRRQADLYEKLLDPDPFLVAEPVLDQWLFDDRGDSHRGFNSVRVLIHLHGAGPCEGRVARGGEFLASNSTVPSVARSS